MKRSYNYSFVSGSPAKANSSVPPYSFSHSTATLAAQSPTFGIQSGTFSKSSLSQTHSTFLTPVEVSPRQPLAPLWYRTNAQGPHRPPLTGLGISISPPLSDGGSRDLSIVQPVSLPLRLPSDSFSSNLRLPSLRELGFEDPNFWSPQNTSCILRPSGSTSIGDTSSPVIVLSGDASGAYSADPSDDYIAHSPSIDGTQLFLPFSPSDIDVKETFLNLDSVPPTPRLPQESSPTEPLIGLFADFNMREFALSQRMPSIGINPALLMGSNDDGTQEDQSSDDDQQDTPTCPASHEIHIQPGSHTSDDFINFTEADVDTIVSVLSASIKKDEAAKTPVPTSRSAASTPVLLPYSNDQGLPVPALPTRSGTIPSAPSPNPANLLPMRPLMSTPKPSLVSTAPSSPRIPLGDITPSIVSNRTSIFSAHRGIDLEDLRSKAEEFRAENPGQDIDKHWLSTYAGKLSEHGERLDEFRCYVKGCSQTNKRRDHILVHVGSHVEFRPFQCDHWYVANRVQDVLVIVTQFQRDAIPAQERVQTSYVKSWRTQTIHV